MTDNETIADIVTEMREATDDVSECAYVSVKMLELFADRIEAAHKRERGNAAKLRNCDVGTAEEQAERWYWRYHVGHLCQSCPLGPRKWSEVDAGTLCFSEWLQMPYEADNSQTETTTTTNNKETHNNE